MITQEPVLRKYIRSILTERAKGPADLGDMKVSVAFSTDAIEVWLFPGSVNTSLLTRHELTQAAVGIISAESAPTHRCLGGYIVGWAHVDDEYKGWGPMLYDITMELAASQGSGILSDRDSVSNEAFSVWKYYADRRSDVEKVQLDDWDDHLTPGNEKDNCDQWRAYEHPELDTWWDSENEETPWDPYGKEALLQSPLTKMYKVSTTPIINALQSLNKLEVLK